MSIPLIARIRTRLYGVKSDLLRQYYNRIWGTHIERGVRLSLTAKLDKTNPKGIHIGEYTIVTFRTSILTHDFVNRRHMDVHIGSHCFIGCGTIIMPGVRIGNHCIIGAGTVVKDDIPDNSVVVGVPGRIIESGIETIEWGMRPIRQDETGYVQP
jgi:acetyltransferase-like isoleucine patch superfamily enzyme